MEQFVVSARKYRPQAFASVIGQKSITTTLKNAILNNHLAHAYLFCGSRGVGKTTCARIFAKTINCSNLTTDNEACNNCESCRSFNENRSYSIHELDGATNNGVDEIRSLVEKVRIPPQIGRKSVYIIDEVHMLSKGAFNAFLKTLEEPPAHTIFILATTEKHKILPTILSRCQIYDFHRIRVDDTVEYLKYIAQQENIAYEEDALHVIAQKSEGAMRDALSTFDQLVSFCGQSLTYKTVIDNLNILDYDYYFQFVDAALQSSYKDALLLFDKVLTKGFDAQYFVSGIANHLRNLMVCKDDETVALLEASESIRIKYKEQAARCNVQYLIDILVLINQCDVGYRTSGNPRLHVELYLLQIANLGDQKKKSTESNIIIPPQTPKIENFEAEVATPTPISPVMPHIAKPRSESSKISLKQIFNQIETPELSDSSVPDTLQITPLRNNYVKQDQLLLFWNKFIEQLESHQIRLKGAMEIEQPTCSQNAENGKTVITLRVCNELQRNEILKNQKEIIDYLTKNLENDNLLLETIIVEVEESEKVLLSSEDLIKKFAQDNPAFIALKQIFDLDYD